MLAGNDNIHESLDEFEIQSRFAWSFLIRVYMFVLILSPVIR